jgi:hypothetical protein
MDTIGNWYENHQEYVHRITKNEKDAYPPSGAGSDRPELWKPAHWLWWLHIARPREEVRSKTRAEIKTRGGQVVARERRGEVVYQLWRLPDGSTWAGDDWYNDRLARVRRVDEQEWRQEHRA